MLLRKKVDWWKFIFNKDYLKTYVDILTEQRTEKELSFILDFIKDRFRNKKIKILDLACGHGRHSLPLAKAGYFVIGIDYSDYFLKLAKKEAKKLKLKNIKFIKKDMRKINFKNEFDLVINMFTSFGYFENEDDNLLVLKNIYQSLKNNGYFILDLENYHRWLTWFIKNGKWADGFLTISSIIKQSNGLEVTTKTWFDIEKMRVFIKREWFENKTKSYLGSFRLYSLNEICNYLKLLNFKIFKIYGDFDKKEFDSQSSRMIIISKK